MTQCELCFHRCVLSEGQFGVCRARVCKDEKIFPVAWGKLTSLALDPIEKKPLRRFHPGSLILSAGSFGCNLRCPFCQNYSISMTDGNDVRLEDATPEGLADLSARLAPRGNIGLAYTYNEPTVNYEFVVECARAIHDRGLRNVLVTNGSLLRKPLMKLLPLIDAMNIDLKGFTENYYRWIGGDLETVKNFISTAAEYGCHVEITTLIVPGKNDSVDEMAAIAAWLANINTEISLHVTRFFPSYKMSNVPPTPVGKIYALANVARRFLRHVYEGNC